MSPRYDYGCVRCNHVVEIVHGMSEHPLVKCDCRGIMIKQLPHFSTSKDRRYDFTTEHIRPGTVIRSKGQWERFLKTNRLTDDLSPKEQLRNLHQDLAQKKSQERRRRFLTEVRHRLTEVAHRRDSPRSLTTKERSTLDRVLHVNPSRR